MKDFVKTISFLTLILLFPILSFSATINVPLDQPTIQNAIDLASNGDTIIVSDGIYTGLGNKDLSFLGKSILLKSENGPAECIIDCENIGRGMIFETGEDNNAIVDGFTIRNGDGGSIGGGILIYSDPTIRNMILTNNVSSMLGGAIMCYGSPNISNCTMISNQSGGGTAIFAFAQDHYVTLDNCIMAFNSGGPTISGDGSALDSIVISCSNSYGNIGDNWTNGMGESNGNISFDPIFCDYDNGDFSIDSLSPCAKDNPLNLCGKLIGALETACQNCEDVDDDGLCAEIDNCPIHYNPDQSDSDHDGVGDVCDGYIGPDTSYVSAEVEPLVLNKFIRASQPFVVNILMNNDDLLRTGMDLPFVFYSSNQSITQVEQIDLGANNGNIAFLNGFETDTYWDFVTQTNTWNWDGFLPDSMRLVCIGVDNGWPPGLGEQVYLQFGFQINQVGIFCIDSIDSPYGDWLWYPEPSPAFGGPYCWRVADFRAECGDINVDGATNILDIVFLISYLYSKPQMAALASLQIYDVNGDDEVNILDITYLIAFLYKSGPAPICL